MIHLKGKTLTLVIFLAIYIHNGSYGSSNGDMVLYPKVICYFPHYAPFRDGIASFHPSNINASLCTHIVYAFAALNTSTLTIQPFNKWADIDNGLYEQITAFSKDGVKVLLNLGGWEESGSDKYSRLVQNQTLRTKFIYDTVCYLQKNNFQGLVLNWEYPKCWQNNCTMGPTTDKKNYASLIIELKTAFRLFNLELAAIVPQWTSLIDAGFDIPTMSNNLDWIGVQTYFTSSAYSPVTEPESPLYTSGNRDASTDFFMRELVTRGADPSKLIVGFPFIARTYTLKDNMFNSFGAATTGPGLPGDYTKEKGLCSYYEICSNILKKKWIIKTSKVNNSIAYKDDQWASYLSTSDVIRRVQFVRYEGYGGAFVFDLTYDDFLNLCETGVFPLLNTLNNELYKSV